MMNVVQATQEMPEAAPASAMKTFRLKRSGIRPKVFEGVELCSAMSHEIGTPFWYELNIYRTEGDGFVGEVRFFTKTDGARDTFKTFDAFDLDSLVKNLEEYDPAADIDPRVWSVEAFGESSATAVLCAAQTSMLIAEAKRQWADIVGEVLFEIIRH